MTPCFDAVIGNALNRLSERYRLSAQPLGMWFEDDICRKNTSLVDNESIKYSRLLEGGSYLSSIKTELHFKDSYFNKSSLCALFWAFQIAVLDQWDLLTRIGAYEEPQNSALFANLSSALRMLGILDKSITSQGDFFLYSADCKSDSTESRLGTDFGIIIPTGEDEYKVALFQAKKANGHGETSIQRESPQNSRYQQLSRMLNIEQSNQPMQVNKQGEFDKYYKSMFFNRICFYVFWHDPTTYLLPTIVSAAQANYQIVKNGGLNYSEIEQTSSNISDADMNIAPLTGGTWFSEAIPLLLADPKSDFGRKMSGAEICALLASKPARPRQIVGLQIPTTVLSLGDWRDLIPEQYVYNEQFYYEGEIYQGRANLAFVKPQTGGYVP
jgi:hypothetical protein